MKLRRLCTETERHRRLNDNNNGTKYAERQLNVAEDLNRSAVSWIFTLVRSTTIHSDNRPALNVSISSSFFNTFCSVNLARFPPLAPVLLGSILWTSAPYISPAFIREDAVVCVVNCSQVKSGYETFDFSLDWPLNVHATESTKDPQYYCQANPLPLWINKYHLFPSSETERRI